MVIGFALSGSCTMAARVFRPLRRATRAVCPGPDRFRESGQSFQYGAGFWLRLVYARHLALCNFQICSFIEVSKQKPRLMRSFPVGQYSPKAVPESLVFLVMKFLSPAYSKQSLNSEERQVIICPTRFQTMPTATLSANRTLTKCAAAMLKNFSPSAAV